MNNNEIIRKHFQEEVEKLLTFVLSPHCSQCDFWKEDLMGLWLEILNYDWQKYIDYPIINDYNLESFRKRIEVWNKFLMNNEGFEGLEDFE